MSVAEEKIKLITKYKWKGVVIVVLTSLLPYGASFLDDYNRSVQTEAVQKVFADNRPLIVNALAARSKPALTEIKDTLMENRYLSISAKAHKLITAGEWNTLVRHRVRSQSLDKVKSIREAFERIDRSDEVGKKRLWAIVKNILYSNTGEYVTELTPMLHPVVGSVGDYLKSSFPMYKDKSRVYRPTYSFLGYVYSIVIETPETNAYVVAEDLTEYMKAIQDEYFTDHYYLLKDMEETYGNASK